MAQTQQITTVNPAEALLASPVTTTTTATATAEARPATGSTSATLATLASHHSAVNTSQSANGALKSGTVRTGGAITTSTNSKLNTASASDAALARGLAAGTTTGDSAAVASGAGAGGSNVAVGYARSTGGPVLATFADTGSPFHLPVSDATVAPAAAPVYPLQTAMSAGSLLGKTNGRANPSELGGQQQGLSQQQQKQAPQQPGHAEALARANRRATWGSTAVGDF